MVKVLVVDDSTIVTNMISGYLKNKGYAIEVANSPFGVTGKIREFRPDVLLMDLGLPGLSGEKLLELCRSKKEATPDCRVVLFSSSDEEGMKALVAQGLANDYFVKGGSLHELEHKIISQAGPRRAT